MELFALSALALVAGLVSFTAPCTLPLLPGYVSFVSGVRSQDSSDRAARARILLGACLFVAGFSVVFVVLGATASGLGLVLAQNRRALEVVAGSFVLLMGLVTAGVLRIPLLQRPVGFDLSKYTGGVRTAFPLGAAFALGWTPCVGPVLAAVLATAASTTTVGQGAVLLLAYSLGLGLPFLGLALAIAGGGGRLTWLRRHGRTIEVGGGLVLAVMGVAVMTGQWTLLMSSMLSVYARLGWPPI